MAVGKRRRRGGMPVRKFLDEVWNNISPEWQRFFASEGLSRIFKRYLRSRFFHFMPSPNGQWSAAPDWNELFAWTVCPPDDIRGIVITMRPMRPGSHPYRSIGFSLGVKRLPHANHYSNIAKAPTVWNFMRLAYEVEGVKWTQDLQTDLRQKYRNGFDLKMLSLQHGVLFLHLQPVAGLSSRAAWQDQINTWAHLVIIPILESIGRNNAAMGRDPIPVIQLYNNLLLESRLEEASGLHVFRPSFMDCSVKRGKRHIKAFTKNSFKTYVEEISADDYEKHRELFWGFHRGISLFHEDLTFTDQDILDQGY